MIYFTIIAGAIATVGMIGAVISLALESAAQED